MNYSIVWQSKIAQRHFRSMPVIELKDAKHFLKSINDQGWWGYVIDVHTGQMMTPYTGPGGQTTEHPLDA